MKLIPVILAGGSGTRLWPLSRSAYPKQFLPLVGEYGLLADTVLRLRGEPALPELSPPVVVAGETGRFFTVEQLQQAGVSPGAVILEPCPRGTAPAVTLAALKALDEKEDALLLVLPADHHIAAPEAFRRGVCVAAAEAARGRLLTFGIRPTTPETGYGYIARGEVLPDSVPETPVYRLERFVEKPNSAEAAGMVASGGYCWNSGMFLFSAGAWCAELGRRNPDMLKACRAAMDNATVDGVFLRPAAEAFASSPADSIDYAVMEQTELGAVLPLDCGWSDVGSWQTLWQISDRDGQGNARRGEVLVRDARDSYLRAEHRMIAALGVQDLIVVETPDVVLVADRRRSQEVKALVDELAAAGSPAVRLGQRDFRPWGSFETLREGEGFKVKRIMVKPGGRLSLQYHRHRAEHWVVVRGEARVEADGQVRLLTADQSAYIPQGSVHRLENPGKEPLEVIEVQTGAYLGEDDIVRLEDQYGREAKKQGREILAADPVSAGLDRENP